MSSNSIQNLKNGTSLYRAPRNGRRKSGPTSADSDRVKMPPPPTPTHSYSGLKGAGSKMSIAKKGKQAVASSPGTKGRKRKAPPIPIQPKQKSEVVSSEKLQNLMKTVDAHAELGKEVEELLGDYADLFLTQILEGASQMAKHRGGTKMEMQDVAIYLERNEKMKVCEAAHGETTVKQIWNKMEEESHKQRVGLINKTINKY